jgi:hypothetical protein
MPHRPPPEGSRHHPEEAISQPARLPHVQLVRGDARVLGGSQVLAVPAGRDLGILTGSARLDFIQKG